MRSEYQPRVRALTKSEAIDLIDDIEHLRRVAHRMWEAFFAAHSQAAHIIGALLSDECRECEQSLTEEGETGCARWREWQTKVSDGFGSV